MITKEIGSGSAKNEATLKQNWYENLDIHEYYEAATYCNELEWKSIGANDRDTLFETSLASTK